MRQLLLHGPAKTASRKKLTELKQKFSQNNIMVFEEGVNIQTLLGNLATLSLFTDEQLVIVENPPADLKLDSLILNNCLTLVLWFDNEVDTKKWPGFEAMFFPESREVSVFPFLDSLAIQDKKAFLEAEKLKKANFDIHYLLTMVFYLLRNLANTPKNAPQFVKEKLIRQRKNFSQDKIVRLYKKMLEIDFKIKSGLLGKDQAEFFLINSFLQRPAL